MKKIDLSIVDDTFLDDYISSINIVTIKSKLSDIKDCKFIIDNLENIIKADVNSIKTKYLNCLSGKSKKDKKKIEEAFNYSGYRKKQAFMKSFKKLNIKSCPFCNNNYVYFYKDNSRNFNTIATLEHYYPKAKYPHLSLSFFNLIPSCYICNSKFKGNDTYVGNIIHPYIEDFDKDAKFKVDINSIGIKKNIDLDIELITTNDKCKQSIKRFNLDKIYEQHNDIAKEIYNKAQQYNQTRIDELYDSFYKDLGYSKEDVKNFAFSSYLEKKDINRRNHTKLTQDILEQFKIL
jgi:hypothetical protein